MTKKDIIRMARKAYDKDMVETWGKTFWTFTQEELERFAALVAAAEREACAKLCDELRDEDGFEPYGTECAAAIRARGDK